jgi:hypothetical protein
MNGANHDAGFGKCGVPPQLTEQRDRSFPVSALTVLVAASAVAILFFFNPSRHGFYPICYFHSITGLKCPGCGSLRALHELLHGNVLEAVRLNALLLLCLPCFGWLAARFFAARLRRQAATFAVQPLFLWAFLCVAMVFTVLRNFHSFAWLAP